MVQDSDLIDVSGQPRSVAGSGIKYNWCYL